ncbi:MAG: aminopeptidase [Candidatus Bathyarchaeia archaeon]
MTDSRVEKLAKLCVHYSVGVKPKELVIIQGSDRAFPLIHELYKECLLSDAYPQIMPTLDVQYTFFRYAKEHQLKFVSPLDKFMAENIDVSIGIFCDPNPKRLTNIDPAKMRTRTASRREIADIFYKREAEKKFRWTGLPFPIDAEAQEASMALSEYEDFVYTSCLVNREDPVAEWTRIQKEQEKTCKFLNQAKEIRVVGEDTDLTYNVKGRKWINCSGQKNMPDGEVFTAPVENSVNGTIRFTFPGIYLGREVEDIKLTFKEGRVVKASAAKGDELLQELLKIEGADRLGETAIGTNYEITRFTKSMLFDEKMGGTMHMALGFNPIPETGGLNKSALHWDILKDMKKDGEIYADKKLFYKNGKFLEF